MTSFNPNYFFHAANVLLLVAYSVRDILELRLFALASALITLPYFALQPAPLWVPLGWTAVFATINGFQSWRLFMERRPVQLTPQGEDARRLLIRDLPPRKVLQVLSIGSGTTLEKGERLIEHGRDVEALWGSALLLSGVTADVDAVAVETVHAMCWEVETLLKFLDANPETRIMMLTPCTGSGREVGFLRIPARRVIRTSNSKLREHFEKLSGQSFGAIQSCRQIYPATSRCSS